MTDTPMTAAEWREALDTLIALRGKGREFDKMHLCGDAGLTERQPVVSRAGVERRI